MTGSVVVGSPPRGTGAKMWRWLVAAACVAMLLGAPLPQIDSDATLSGEIASHIVATGDWLSLRYPVHYSHAVVDKPPLLYWIMAVSLRLGGHTDVSLRLWNIVVTILVVLVVYRIARLDLREEDAQLAALLAATFQQVFYQSSMTPQHDILLTLLLSLAFYAYLRYRRERRDRWVLLTGLWTALAVLTKGVLFLPAVAGIVGADTVVAWWSGERSPWRFRHIAAGAFVFTVIAAPWFAIEAVREGAPFVRVLLFDAGSFGRLSHPFLGPGLVSLHGFLPMTLGYVPILIAGMLPWTGLLPAALTEGWRSLRGGPPALRLSMVWLVLYFLVLSLSHGDRIARYLSLCYPPLAVLAGRALGAALDARARLGVTGLILSLLGPLALGVGLLLARRLDPVAMRFYTPIVAPPLVLFALTILAFVALAGWGRLRHAVVLAAVGSLISYTVAYGMIMDRWTRLWPWPAVGATVNRLYRPGDRVVVVGQYPVEANFAAYWIRPTLERVNEDGLADLWPRYRIFALLSPEKFAHLSDRLRLIVLLRTPLGWSIVTNRIAQEK